MHLSHRTIQQGNRNDGTDRNDNDDDIDGTDSNGTDGDNDNDGITKKVRRAHTPFLHPHMHACKHSTAAPASACPAFGHCAKHKPPQTATKLQQPGPGRSSLNRPPERPLNRPLNRPLETAHNSPNELGQP
jgi:hypothetical protein